MTNIYHKDLTGADLHVPPVIVVNDDYTIQVSDHTIKCTVAGKIMTLPSASGEDGRPFVIDNASDGDISVECIDSSESINGEWSQIIPSGCSMSIYSDGSNWRIF